MALPPGAEVHVVLEDQSRMDAPATVITDYTHVASGPPPYDFRMVVDPSMIDDRMRYGLRARIEHEDQLMFTSTEHIDPFAGAAGEPIEIMVSRVGGGPNTGRSAPSKPDVALTDAHWKLVELGGKPAEPGAGEKELSLVLASEGRRASGFSGCNDFAGEFDTDGNTLTFGPLASTRKACMDGMEQEQTMLQALSNVASYAIEGDSLALMTPDGSIVMRFKAVTPPPGSQK
jgi:putative lipoprotein